MTQTPSQTETVPITEGDIKNQTTPKQALITELITKIELCKKKIDSRKVPDHDKRAWLRLEAILLRAAAEYFTKEYESRGMQYTRIEFVAPWENKFYSPQTTTSPTPGNENSTTTPTDIAFSVAVEDGAKTTAPYMKPLNTVFRSEP